MTNCDFEWPNKFLELLCSGNWFFNFVERKFEKIFQCYNFTQNSLFLVSDHNSLGRSRLEEVSINRNETTATRQFLGSLLHCLVHTFHFGNMLWVIHCLTFKDVINILHQCSHCCENGCWMIQKLNPRLNRMTSKYNRYWNFNYLLTLDVLFLNYTIRVEWTKYKVILTEDTKKVLRCF